MPDARAKAEPDAKLAALKAVAQRYPARAHLTLTAADVEAAA